MIFTYPLLFPLLALPVLLGFWSWFARGQQLALPLDHAQARRGRLLQVAVRIANLAPYSLLAAALLLLAQPLEEGPPSHPTQVTNIQIALDTSGSMNEAFGDRVKADGNQFTRFDAAMEAIDQFTQRREGDAFGLSIFTRKVIHWAPLTTDLSAIRLSTPFVRPGAFPLEWWDGTLIGNAILTCADLLEERSEGDRMLILLTDGESSDLQGELALQAGQKLQEKNITLYAISVRAESYSEDLSRVCELSGGRLFESGDVPALQAVFQEIDQLQRAKLASAQTRWLQFDRPFAWAGLFLLALQQLAALGLRYAPW
ncbi:vWA domain-containing protein [Lignipirellula cremea]|uniref:von Willebrand factor type A domain protein n=1 Tax=Lignipirellula cremea TaxID=2528010 RepID=A0A518DLY5_9BACT|nr:VWA domain-containing protein [Lignipirellula cremea]QDU92858.1 von Willebrand factor type A domain protein [Lignipirellula cremea]